ncbi:MAG: SDR family oxidoreductase [Burkholderiales bacterium]|jgi:NAD(P)-dependent dehydrogenase (short-subunit alcohol dehydrogenase family)|nr:SDR family oxidoreductase [Rhodocyclaceae bacterium]MCA3020583.1 SDR family oxidoreductase [Rhodocyclaceae bacterium]MCA3053719.1 SDR family oxidoreductase [Rhodocyclaceae bacterium]
MQVFSNRVAVITGAGSGFGREFALTAAGLGMRLVLADIQPGPLDETKKLVGAKGATAVTAVCDVSKAADVESLAALALSSFGGVNLLFNNAGVGSGGLVWENTVKDWDWVLGVNVWGVIHGVRVFTPLMLEQAKADPEYEGHIVNTASMAGLLSPQLMGAYNVSKHAVVALSETLYHDLGAVQAQGQDSAEGHGRRLDCSVLCPAFVPTGISQSHRVRPSALLNDDSPTASMKLAQSMTHKAVSSGKLTAADVSRITFDAIRNQRFYIITHPKIMATVQMRLDDIAQQNNPRDPFGMKQSVRPDLSVL